MIAMMSCLDIDNVLYDVIVNACLGYNTFLLFALHLYQAPTLIYHGNPSTWFIFKRDLSLQLVTKHYHYHRKKLKKQKKIKSTVHCINLRQKINLLHGIYQLVFNFISKDITMAVSDNIYKSFIRRKSNPQSDPQRIPRIGNTCCYHVALSTDSTNGTGPATVLWDTDSYPIRVDNCCTKTISFDINDFIPSTLVPVHNRTVSGFVEGSTTAIEQQGTIKWQILDDQGSIRELIIPNSFWVPGGNSRLLSPQHWAQEVDNNYPLPHGTRCITNGDAVMLQWNQRNYSKTITLEKDGTNVGTMWSKPGYDIASKVMAYVIETHPTLCFSSETIDIINQDPYDPNIDDDGIIIEPPDNQPLISPDENNIIKHDGIQESNVNELEQSLINIPQWDDQFIDPSSSNTDENVMMVK
jgi:hypothetical protein